MGHGKVLEHEKRVYVSGTFDLFHPGHVELFRRAKEIGTVIASLNTDDFVTRFKRRPIMNLAERMAMVKACRYVDEALVNEGGEDSKPAILAARATHIFHGDDWIGNSFFKQMDITQEWLDEHHIKMVYAPYTKSISTSEIIRRCQSSLAPGTSESKV